ncbi:MAG: MATE family efflux transporter [Gammaproteobacteria bacterium]|jgi:putative MATE family efflux protein|nr:MATE family efflux transporter [Gammaproteobacteria bacterium]MDP6733002.1 MATE family efflux transporter [Gammaproteobacteria bacterium]
MTINKLKSGWQLFRQALAGDSDINYTEGSIARVTILLAIPMILEMAMESVFAIVDIFFVSSLGTDAVATVGLTEAVITLLYAIAIGLSMGATAMVARRIGEQDSEGASIAAGQIMWIGVFVSVVVGLIGIFFARNILAMMGAEESVIEQGANYTRLMFGACSSIVFLFLINAIFRGAGDATIAMRALWLANGINIVLDPCFIFGLGPFPELGVTGAAVATNIGRSIGVLYGLYHLVKGDGRLQLHLANMGLRLAVAWSLVRISAGGMAQFLVATASWVFLMQIVSGFGSAAVAGYTIAVRVVMFSILPAWGLSNAAATLVGQNLGAGLPERAETTTWKIAKYNSMYMGLAAALMLLFTQPIVAMFSQEAEVLSYAMQCLRIFAYGYVFWGFGMAIIQAFNGAGDTMTPTYINIFCFWIVQVPLAYTLALGMGIGPVGVFWAVFVSDVLAGIVGVALFLRGKWKLRMV